MKSYLVSSCKGKQRLLYSFVKDNNQLKTNSDWIHLVTDITQIHEISFVAVVAIIQGINMGTEFDA